MNKEKLYFLNIDDTNVYPLSDRLNDAKLEGLEKVTLIEAIPDNDNPDYIWCGEQGEVGERSECKKSVCLYYESKSGRGVCRHRGKLYQHGEEVEFKVEKFDVKKWAKTTVVEYMLTDEYKRNEVEIEKELLDFVIYGKSTTWWDEDDLTVEEIIEKFSYMLTEKQIKDINKLRNKA